MALATRLRTLRHALFGVPRIYGSARRAGLGRRDAVRAVDISGHALRVAAARGAGEPGRQNALRHFLWQTLLTAHFGRTAAQAIAEDQERGAADAADSRVDRHNNRVGQEYGAAHARELAARTVSDALGELVPVALAKWESDELIWVR